MRVPPLPNKDIGSFCGRREVGNDLLWSYFTPETKGKANTDIFFVFKVKTLDRISFKRSTNQETI